MSSIVDSIATLIQEQIELQTLHRDDRKGILEFTLRQLAQMWEDGEEVQIITEFKDIIYGDM